MPKGKNWKAGVRLNTRYDELRRRVKQEYGLPSLTAADAFIAANFEEYENQKAFIFGGQKKSKPDSKKLAEDVSKMIYGGGFV